jgi:hypothetical protein
LVSKGRDYVILVNHTSATVSGEVVAARGSGEVMHILPGGIEPVVQTDGTWHFELSGFAGTLFEWRHVSLA